VNNHSSALKFLYKAQAILVKARDKGVSRSSPIYLMAHVMTFVVLWRAKQYRDAQDYARICEDLVAKEIYELPEAGGYSRNREIVIGLIRLGKVACEHQLSLEGSKAIPTLQAMLSNRPPEPLFLLISAIIKDLQTLPKSSSTAPPSLDYVSSRQDWLVTPSFLRLVHITLYLPCIGTSHSAPNTPIIPEKALEDAREKPDGEFKRVLETQGDHFRLVQHIIQTQAQEQYPSKPRFRSHSRGVNDYMQGSKPKGVRKLRSGRHISLPLATFDQPQGVHIGQRSKSRGPMTGHRRPIMVELAPDRGTNQSGILDIKVLPGLFQSDSHSQASRRDSESSSLDLQSVAI
jgi:hypothetical protein